MFVADVDKYSRNRKHMDHDSLGEFPTVRIVHPSSPKMNGPLNIQFSLAKRNIKTLWPSGLRTLALQLPSVVCRLCTENFSES